MIGPLSAAEVEHYLGQLASIGGIVSVLPLGDLTAAVRGGVDDQGHPLMWRGGAVNARPILALIEALGPFASEVQRQLREIPGTDIPRVW